MAKGWKLGAVYEYKGRKVVVSAINSDGTVTLNFAAGSGKTGFAGTIANPGVKVNLEKSFNVPEDEVEGEGISLDEYNAADEYKALTIGDVLVTHNNGNVGKIVRIDDKNISGEYLKKNFPDFKGTYVGYAVKYEKSVDDTIKDKFKKDDFEEGNEAWTTVVELTEGGITRRYVVERNKDEDEA
jgi:hypothetical protein